MSADILRDFALATNGVSALATMQRSLIVRDIERTKDTGKQGLKRQWFQQWNNIVQQWFREFPAGNASGYPSFLSDQALKERTAELRKNSTQCGLVLLELVAFAPYFPFDADQAKKFKGITADSATRSSFLEKSAVDLGFSSEKASKLDEALQSTADSLSGRWWKFFLGVLVGLGLGALTMGLAAPFVGGLVGAAMGLHGAAATAAGLAALGGGSLAAGGLGMAGGTAVLVGGGTLLGLGAGAAGGHWVGTMNSGTALLQAAKLEVALKEVILQGQYDVAKAQEILILQRQAIQQMETEIDRLRMTGKGQEKRIDELEKAVKILQEALKRNQTIFKGAA